MEQIKQEIINNVYENGENLITGPILQEVLLDMVDDYNSKVSSGSVPGDLVEKTGSWDDAADWVEDNSGSLVHDTDLDGYATEQWVEDQGYLKEVPEGYATTESLNELSESVAELSSSIPSIDLSGYATTESVNEATQSVKDWVESKHYLTTASLSGSVTEESVQFMINDSTASMKEWVESQSYATETFVSESIANLDIPDTSGFVTTQSYNQDSASFDERINSISGSDLSGYATTESLNQLSESVAEDLEGKADRSDLPDLTGYATEQWVQEQGYLTEHQDISGLATTESVNNLSESVANDFANLNIPDVSGLATTSSVNSLSESVATDITGLSESIAAITGSDLSGYATTESLNQVSQSLSASIAAISGSGADLSVLANPRDPDNPVFQALATASFAKWGNGKWEIDVPLEGEVEGNVDTYLNLNNVISPLQMYLLQSGIWKVEFYYDEGEDKTYWRIETQECPADIYWGDNLIGKFLQSLGLADWDDSQWYSKEPEYFTEASASFDQRINNITGSGVDLSGYVTTASYNNDSASFDQRIDAIVVPDLSEYATTSSVNSISESLSQSIAAITGSDLSGYATTESVNNLSSSVNNTFNQYATTQSVTQLSQSISQSISQITGSAPDLSGYATTSSVNALSESVATDFENLDIPDISGLATTSSVNSLSASFDQRINNITASGEDTGLRSFLFGNLTQNLNSISGSAANIYSEINTNVTLGFSNLPDDGKSIGITVHNTAASESIVSLPDSVTVGGVTYNLINNGADNSGSVGIPAGEYGDIVVTRKGTDLFLRTSVDLSSVSGSAPDLSGYATTASLLATGSQDNPLFRALHEVGMATYNTDADVWSIELPTSGEGTWWDASVPGLLRQLGESGILRYHEEDDGEGNMSWWIETDGLYQLGNPDNPIGRFFEDKGMASYDDGEETWVFNFGAPDITNQDDATFSVLRDLGLVTWRPFPGPGQWTTASLSPWSGGTGTSTAQIGHYAAASGNYAIAQGQGAKAYGSSSFAQGIATNATEAGELAAGKSNFTSSGQIFSVGVGDVEVVSGSVFPGGPTVIRGYNPVNQKNAISVITGSNPSASVYIIGVGGYDGTNPTGSNDLASVIANLEASSGVTIVTTLTSGSTDLEVPSAKCVYDLIGDIESALIALR